MIKSMTAFFYMNGYGYYIWPAYGIVIFYLFIQWFTPWKKQKIAVREYRLKKVTQPNHE